MKDALTIHRMLLERETLHEIVRLPRAISHADELPKVLELPAERCLVTHVYTVGSTRREARALAGVIVAAGREPAAEVIRHRLGARTIRHARADQINAATEYTAYLVCPLLLPPAMRLFIDRRILLTPQAADHPADHPVDPAADHVVYTAAGEPFTALAIRLPDLCALSGAEPIDLPTEPIDLPAATSSTSGRTATVMKGATPPGTATREALTTD